MIACRSCAEFKHHGRAHTASTSLRQIIRDEYLVVLGINFGAELVLLQALIDDAQRLFLDADREAFSRVEVPLCFTAILRDRIILACFTSPEPLFECCM